MMNMILAILARKANKMVCLWSATFSAMNTYRKHVESGIWTHALSDQNLNLAP